MADNGLPEIGQRTGLMGDSSSRQRLSSEAHESYVQSAIKEVTATFTNNTNVQSEVGHYGAGFLKTAALFMPGRVGLIGSVVLSGLDQACPSSTASEQATDFVLGGMKGAGMRGMMHMMGSEKMPEFIAKSPAAQGVAFGLSNRIMDTALTRQNYLDANGNLDGAAFGAKMYNTVVNPTALLGDAATFVIAQGLVSGVTKFKPQFFETSPLARTVATSASFGLANGASGEIMRQQGAHEKFDLSKVVGRSLLQGGIDAVAGVPGGLRANVIAGSQAAESTPTPEFKSIKLNDISGHLGHSEFKLTPTSSGFFQAPHLVVTTFDHSIGSELARSSDTGSKAHPITHYWRTIEREPGSQSQPAAAQVADHPLATPQFFSSLERADGSTHVNLVTSLKGDEAITRYVEKDTQTHDVKEEPKGIGPDVVGENSIASVQNRARVISDLTIPHRSLNPQPERIASTEQAQEKWPERSDDPGPFQSFDDFYHRGVTRNMIDTRVFKISGHDVRVILPERYAAGLDGIATNQARPEGTEDYANRLSPSDLPPLLDAMPDSRYFKKIYMSDVRNPEDAWVSQGGYNSDFVTAMSMIEGQLTTYKTDRSDYLRRDILHEWSHELRYEYWDDDIAFRFRNAVDLETEWKPSAYAGRNNGEQWAVLGERMLGNDASEFLDAAEHAPIRTVIWMRALKKCLDNVPAENQSVDHDLYVARQKFVDETILPLAVKKLNNFVETGSQEQIKWAQDVLDYLNAEGLLKPPQASQ